jgi:hypothetical protein
VNTGRIHLSRIKPGGNPHDTVVQLVQVKQGDGHSVSVFTHTIAATADLSDALTAAGIRHEQVGPTKAYGEALNAQLAPLKYAVEGATGGRRALAVYVAANSKGRNAPPLALQILHASCDSRSSEGQLCHGPCASSTRIGRAIPLRRSSPISTKLTPSGGGDSTTLWLTRTCPAPARAAIRAARLTVRPK